MVTPADVKKGKTPKMVTPPDHTGATPMVVPPTRTGKTPMVTPADVKKGKTPKMVTPATGTSGKAATVTPSKTATTVPANNAEPSFVDKVKAFFTGSEATAPVKTTAPAKTDSNLHPAVDRERLKEGRVDAIIEPGIRNKEVEAYRTNDKKEVEYKDTIKQDNKEVTQPKVHHNTK